MSLFGNSLIAFVVTLALATVREAEGQDFAVVGEDQGPRFLLASASQLVPLDVDRTPSLARRLELSLEGVTLKNALAEIRRRGALRLAFSDDDVPVTRRVYLRAEAITVAAALTDVLLGTGLDVVFGRDGGASLVKRSEFAVAQPGRVVGQVADQEKEVAIAGAEVWLEGTTWRTLTGEDGRYVLAEVTPGSYTVSVRRIGYGRQSKPVTVGDGQEVMADFALLAAAAHLGDILVTAQKREERVQDIPLSIAVISNEDIERRGLIGMEDYLRGIPAVNQIDNGPMSNAIVIRGITTSPEFENFSSGTTVASYFDETPITGAAGLGSGGIDVRPVDIERIEILRGPQGTAYGSASLGGTLRIIPAKPTLGGFSARFAGSFSGTGGYGSEDWMGQGVVNLPIVKDKAAVRAVGYRYDESGYYRNIAGIDPATIAAADNLGLGDFVRGHVQDGVGQIVSTGGRIAGLWQPTEKLNLSLNFLTQKIEQDGSPLATVGTYEQTRTPIASQGRVRGEVGEINDTKLDLLNLVLNYDFGWAELTAAASGLDGGAAWASASSFQFGLPSTTARGDHQSFTGEARLASQLKGRFQFLGGAFYSDIKDDYLESNDWPGTPETNPFGTNPQFYSETTRDLDEGAIFGELSYDLSDKLTATVGGRYFDYDRNERQLFEGGAVGVPIGEGVPFMVGRGESGSSFKANLSYKPTPNALLYASWGEGFRLGRAAAGLPTAVCDVDSDGLADGTNISIESTRRINSDFLDNYEIGGKFELFNSRMVVQPSAYHIYWDGLPIFTVVGGTGGCAELGYTANVGAATSTGVEVQTSVFVEGGLRLDLGGSYTRAKLSKDAPGLGAQEGARLPGSPQVSANFAAQYDFDVAGYDAFVRGDAFYTGEFYGDLQETLDQRAGDYIKVDARAGVAIRDLSVELFVRNLTDDDAFTWRGILAFGNPVFGYRLRPRTIGIQLGYQFE